MVIMARINNPQGSGLCFINMVSGKLPAEVINDLDEVLSDYVQGFEWMDTYKSGEWDGRYRLFKQAKNGAWYFPIGYLKVVIDYLRSSGVIIHSVVVSVPKTETLGIQWDNKIMRLRPYQQEIVDKIIENNGWCTIQIPTGAGKTAIALRVATMANTPFLVVVHRKELLYQWKSEIERLLKISPVLYGAGHKEEVTGERPAVVMVQSLIRLVKKGYRFSFPFVIFDEVHTTPANEAYSVAMNIGARWRLGLSATARREDGKDKMLFGAAGEIIHTLKLTELVEKGYLIEPKFRLYEVPYPAHTIGDYARYSEVYKMGVTHHKARNEIIAREAQKGLEEGRLVFINVRHIEHGKKLNRLIPDSYFIHGTSPDRQEMLQAFKDGVIRCLISTLLREGVDIPAASQYINAAGGASSIATIQTAGRVMRTADGKEDTLIIELIDNCHKFLIRHTQQRFGAYSAEYGEYFDNAEVIK